MNADAPTPCSSCGNVLPREEMFGLEPLLQCPDCAQNIRQRTQVRTRVVITPRKPVVTAAFVGICTVLFLVIQKLRFDESYPTWLEALMQDLPIWKGEIWRHVSCTMIHFDWWHWIMNGMALWSLGRWFETAYGSLATFATIILTGVAGAALHWIFEVGPAIGISGAIFGLCGVFWAQRRVNPVAAAILTDRLRNWLLVLLGAGIILDMTGSLAISNWGHGGGLAAGLLLGWAGTLPRRKLLLPLSALLIVGVAIASIYVSLGTSKSYQNTLTKEFVPGAELRKSYLAGQLDKKP